MRGVDESQHSHALLIEPFESADGGLGVNNARAVDHEVIAAVDEARHAIHQNVLAARVSLPPSRYSDDARVRNFLEGLLERIRSIPGVENAGITNLLPFTGNANASIVMIDGYRLAAGENPPVPGHNHVDPGYFQTMGIPLLQVRSAQPLDGNAQSSERH